MEMQTIKEFLLEMGFGKNETEIYSSLIEIGTSSVLQISKKTGLHRSNIYDALRKLLKEGLVFEINKPTKLFYARSPKGLIDYLKIKEAELNEILKDYDSKIKTPIREKVVLSEGKFAVREAINGLLDLNSRIDVYGIPANAFEIIGPILKDFHKERIKRKIQMRHIYNSGAIGRVKFLNKMEHTEAKLLPSKYDSFATTNITKEKIVIFLWEDEITVIEIFDENLAKPYQNYFEVLWSKAKKP